MLVISRVCLTNFTHLELNRILSKIEEIFHLVSLAYFTVIGIGETNFDSSFLNNEIASEGYDLIRTDHSRKEWRCLFPQTLCSLRL